MDLNRCIYCRACEVACEREHAGLSNMFVQLINEQFALPVNCRHCETSPCTLACPTHAIHRDGENPVVVSPMQCIGCGLCSLACPFGAVWVDVVNHVARKCDLCVHRLESGLEPACLASCSSRAIAYGEMEEMLEIARSRNGRTLISRAAGSSGTVITLPVAWTAYLEDQEEVMTW
jgi:formate dehydrogenase iron-sulfur subunit